MPNSINVGIGKKISQRIDELSLKREEVAAALGVTVDVLKLLETGEERASALMLQSLTRILDVPVSYFYEADDPKNTFH